MKTDFLTLAQLYKDGKLTPVLRREIQKDLNNKKEHPKQRHFKTKCGRVIDLVALKESILKNDDLFIYKLPNKQERGCFDDN